MASVLITGASKGIGRATAAELTRRGHRVIATARDPRTLAGLPVDQRLALDVTDPDSIAPAVRLAGEIDVLVSNAGEIFYAAVGEQVGVGVAGQGVGGDVVERTGADCAWFE